MMNGRTRCLARESKFVKVLIEDFAERLRIPKVFIEEMPEELSGSAILHVPSSKCWHVKLSKTSKGTYLEEGGWEAFVKDNSLTAGEFLIFSYVSSMHFNVKIFGRNACEREDAFTVQASSGLTCHQVQREAQSPQGDEGKIASTSKPKALGEEANEAAYRFNSRFPFFLSQIKSYSIHTHYYLTVPALFVKEHLPKTRMMMLRVANERTWMVKYCFGLPSRISRGWKPFTSDNHIKVGDFCVFELVKEDIFQVHIFRC